MRKVVAFISLLLNTAFYLYSQDITLSALYHQKTGQFTFTEHAEGRIFECTCWSGNGENKNIPDKDNILNSGPIPKGVYFIVRWSEESYKEKGPYVIFLKPHPTTEKKIIKMGRDPNSFLIHGPSIDPKKYGEESNGCIIMEQQYRKIIIERILKIKDLVVVGVVE